MPLIDLERMPYRRIMEPLKPVRPVLRETEHHALVKRVENLKKEVAELKAQLAQKENELKAVTGERDRLKAELNKVVPALAERLASLENTVAEKIGQVKAERFVPPKP